MSGVYYGGPAFPVPGLQEDAQFNGISLRAYFAAHAPEVPGDFERRTVEVVVDDLFGPVRKRVERAPETRLQQLVRWRLAYADAMLKALK